MKTPTALRKYQLLIVMLTVLPLLAHAANLTWDANTSATGAQDGSGTWDTATANWLNGGVNSIWSSVTPDAALFGSGGAAGTVTLGANIVCGNITFNAGGAGNYTIAGGGFQLAMTNRTITANVSGTISADIVPNPTANSALSLANSVANQPSAVLTLSGNNSYTNFNLGANAA